MKNHLLLLIAVCFIVICCSCGYNSDNIESAKLSGYNEGYNVGLAKGFDDGYSTGYDEKGNETPSISETYLSIEDMSTEDILDYLGEDVHNIYVYGFMKGYRKCSNGSWDEITEEYINDYDYEFLDKKFSFRFP